MASTRQAPVWSGVTSAEEPVVEAPALASPPAVSASSPAAVSQTDEKQLREEDLLAKLDRRKQHVSFLSHWAASVDEQISGVDFALEVDIAIDDANIGCPPPPPRPLHRDLWDYQDLEPLQKLHERLMLQIMFEVRWMEQTEECVER